MRNVSTAASSWTKLALLGMFAAVVSGCENVLEKDTIAPAASETPARLTVVTPIGHDLNGDGTLSSSEVEELPKARPDQIVDAPPPLDPGYPPHFVAPAPGAEDYGPLPVRSEDGSNPPFAGSAGDTEGGHRLEVGHLESITGVYTGNHAVDRSIPSAHDDLAGNGIFAPTTVMGTPAYTHELGCLEVTHITANDMTGFDDDAEYHGVWDFCEENDWAFKFKINFVFEDDFVRTWSKTGKKTYWTMILWEDVDGDGDKDNRSYIYNWDKGQWQWTEISDPTVCTLALCVNEPRPWHMWEGINWENNAGTCEPVATTYGGNWKVASGGAWVQPSESQASDFNGAPGTCFDRGLYSWVDLEDDYLTRWDTN